MQDMLTPKTGGVQETQTKEKTGKENLEHTLNKMSDMASLRTAEHPRRNKPACLSEEWTDSQSRRVSKLAQFPFHYRKHSSQNVGP